MDNLILSVHRENPKATENLTTELKKHISKKQPIKFICIGTDRSTGDSLGPLIGTFLKEKGFDVEGTLDDPVHAENIEEVVTKLSKDNLIFAIDACLSSPEEIGNIKFKKGSLKPGSGVGKELPPVGDYQISANVNAHGFFEYIVLQNTRLSEIMQYAKIISSAIEMAFQSNR